MKRFFTFFFALVATTTLWAEDFSVDGIYYNILTYKTNEVEVTSGSSKYSGSVTIPETVTYSGTTYSVTSIGNDAFFDCDGLTSVTIPNSVTSIGGSAFWYCDGLTSPVYNAHCFAYMPSSYSGAYAIPEGIKQIAGFAFNGCSSLTSITIPNSVTSIEVYAFEGCSGLTSIVVEEGNTIYDSRENCNAIIGTASNTLITGCQNTIIPNSVTSIGIRAFSDCSGLTSITIPNSVTSIGIQAFLGCSGLTSVTIPNSVTSIGDEAFDGCSGLTSITIPNSVTSIGIGAFEYCSGLTSITIPNSVTSIGFSAFGGCSGLTSIVVEEGNTMYDSRENCNAIIETATNTLIRGCQNTIIPNNVTSIGWGAFSSCSGLTSITIPNSVTSIGIGAFEYCSGLTSIIIPNSVTSIGNYAFHYCTGLTSITIPNSVTSIGDRAFGGCWPLAVVNVEATTPPTLGTDAFTSSPTCNIPCGTLEVYQASDWQNVVGEFVEQCSDDSGDDGDMDKDLTIVFSDQDNNELSAQTVALRVPVAPQIAGFTFLYWLPVAEPLDDVITLQAVYESNTPTAAPEVYVNPSNPAQKLIRNGQVYILHEEKMYTISGQVVK